MKSIRLSVLMDLQDKITLKEIENGNVMPEVINPE